MNMGLNTDFRYATGIPKLFEKCKYCNNVTHLDPGVLNHQIVAQDWFDGIYKKAPPKFLHLHQGDQERYEWHCVLAPTSR